MFFNTNYNQKCVNPLTKSIAIYEALNYELKNLISIPISFDIEIDANSTQKQRLNKVFKTFIAFYY